MSAQTRAMLYTFFESGDKPTQGQFADLIDSSLNISDVSAQSIASDVSCLGTLDVNNTFTVTSSSLSNLTGNVNIVGALNVSGAANFSGGFSFGASANLVVGGNLNVSGNASIAGNTALNIVSMNIISTDVAVSGRFTPNEGIVALATAANPSTGLIGNVIEVSAQNVSMASNAATTIVTIPLQAGHWDVISTLRYIPDAATTIAGIIGGISDTTDSLSVPDKQIFAVSLPFQTGTAIVQSPPSVKLAVAASANYFLVAQSNFAVSGMVASGNITATRTFG